MTYRMQFQCFGKTRVIKPAIAPPCIIGRALTSDIVIRDLSVSRRHARLYQRGRRVYIEDLKSTNGVLVNGIPIKKSAIAPGDIILLGNCAMQLEPKESALEENAPDLGVAEVSPVASSGWFAVAVALFRCYGPLHKQADKAPEAAFALEALRDVKTTGELPPQYTVHPTRIG